jgi:hypothetical protein
VLTSAKAIKSDPLWRPLDYTVPGPELLVESVESMWLKETDYSRKLEPKATDQPRVFELRTYLSPDYNSLLLLHDRFRNHTAGLFEKHGLDALVYWNVRSAEDGERKLVYLLAHESVESAKEKFSTFAKDPEWRAARAESERRAGGPLTERRGGVQSEFLVGVDFSALR